mmetsp:Transcript_4921/g.19704  ORF Transcript_4921/g.19704 Transcript_4921/m.19704 type:complete len:265 (+) Transcript_4921:1877-2671(+)
MDYVHVDLNPNANPLDSARVSAANSPARAFVPRVVSVVSRKRDGDVSPSLGFFRAPFCTEGDARKTSRLRVPPPSPSSSFSSFSSSPSARPSSPSTRLTSSKRSTSGRCFRSASRKSAYRLPRASLDWSPLTRSAARLLLASPPFPEAAARLRKRKTFGAVRGEQKFCVTAAVSVKFKAACHHPLGTNKTSPAKHVPSNTSYVFFWRRFPERKPEEVFEDSLLFFVSAGVRVFVGASESSSLPALSSSSSLSLFSVSLSGYACS